MIELKKMQISTTIKQTMIADDDMLVITDPCYIMSYPDWEDWLNMQYKDGVELIDYLRKNKNFGEMLCDDTNIGDWDNFVKDADSGEIIGEFTADAGMVICCKLSDLMNYNGFDWQKLERYADRGLATIIPNFTGKVVLEKELDNGIAFNTVIRGYSDDFNFATRAH